MQRGILAAVCALVVGVYVYAAHTVPPCQTDDYYNLLVQGFRTGQLNLKKEAPPGLAQLADPYAEAYAFYYQEVGDMSYYKGKLYLYFGVTPAVVLFWPYVALTGHYLHQRDGIVVFCVVGFLTSAGLLRVVWRRYFAEVRVWVMALGTLALGLAMGAPLVLTRCAVYEVPITCGYALTMLTLAAIWKALHESRKRWGWLAAASLAYGLAVAARPNLLFGGFILLVPALHAWRERRKIGVLLLAATGPILLVGLGLMLYNALRFDGTFEFGQHYQINDQGQFTRQFFSLRYLWFNFRVYFLEPVRWGHRFPFVHDIKVPALPAGHGLAEQPFGVLTNIPLVWLALALPLAWRGRSAEVRSTLHEILLAVAVLFGICTLTLCLFAGACTRYEMEFLPELMLLAVIGILGLERSLSPTSESEQAHRLVCRRAARWGWSLLLGCSVAFNLLASVGQSAEAHNNLGMDLAQQGKVQEAVEQYDQALRLSPDYPKAHSDLASALMRQGRLQEAIEQYEQAVRLKPDFAEAHYNFGNALLQAGRVQDAIDHYERAVRIAPDFVLALYNLGSVLAHTGRMQAAIQPWEQALRVRPDFAEAHYSLGVALEQAGRVQDAIQHYEQALRIKPDFVEAQRSLAQARAAQ